MNDFLPGVTKGGCSRTLHLIDAVIIKLSLAVYICNHLFVTRGHDRFALWSIHLISFHVTVDLDLINSHLNKQIRPLLC